MLPKTWSYLFLKDSYPQDPDPLVKCDGSESLIWNLLKSAKIILVHPKRKRIWCYQISWFYNVVITIFDFLSIAPCKVIAFSLVVGINLSIACKREKRLLKLELLQYMEEQYLYVEEYRNINYLIIGCSQYHFCRLNTNGFYIKRDLNHILKSWITFPR